MANSLTHYGVKGMKWGVRKERKPSSDHLSARSLRKKRRFELTNAELTTVNRRLNLEREYRRLTAGDRTLGQQGVDRFLNLYGNQVIAGAAGIAAGMTIAYMKKKL